MAVATDLEKGKWFLVNNEPVRVTRKEVVAVGTHSHTKLKIFFQGLAAKGEKSITLGHTDKVELLDITRKHGQVISKNNTFQRVHFSANLFLLLQIGGPVEKT